MEFSLHFKHLFDPKTSLKWDARKLWTFWSWSRHGNVPLSQKSCKYFHMQCPQRYYDLICHPSSNKLALIHVSSPTKWSIFYELWVVWNSGKTLSWVFDVSPLSKLKLRKKRRNKVVKLYANQDEMSKHWHAHCFFFVEMWRIVKWFEKLSSKLSTMIFLVLLAGNFHVCHQSSWVWSFAGNRQL